MAGGRLSRASDGRIMRAQSGKLNRCGCCTGSSAGYYKGTPCPRNASAADVYFPVECSIPGCYVVYQYGACYYVEVGTVYQHLPPGALIGQCDGTGIYSARYNKPCCACAVNGCVNSNADLSYHRCDGLVIHADNPCCWDYANQIFHVRTDYNYIFADPSSGACPIEDQQTGTYEATVTTVAGVSTIVPPGPQAASTFIQFCGAFGTYTVGPIGSGEMSPLALFNNCPRPVPVSGGSSAPIPCVSSLTWNVIDFTTTYTCTSFFEHYHGRSIGSGTGYVEFEYTRQATLRTTGECGGGCGGGGSGGGGSLAMARTSSGLLVPDTLVSAAPKGGCSGCKRKRTGPMR